MMSIIAITRTFDTAGNLSILHPQSEFAAFYQQILCDLSNVEKLGRSLVKRAEIAQAFRQPRILEGAATILANLPLKDYSLIGEYYLAWLSLRSGSVSPDVFGRVYDLSSSYKTQALWSLAAIEAAKGNTAEELKLYLEALRTVSDLPTFIATTRGVAVAKAKEGFHKQAVSDLESLLPVVRYASPFTYFAVLNSLAVELGEVGRIEEASNICKIVLASPFASAYPEWHDTGAELAKRTHPRNRSFLYVSFDDDRQCNILLLPVRALGATAPDTTQAPATVSSIQEWKKMPKTQGDDDRDYELSNNPTRRDIFLRIVDLASNEDLSVEKLWKMLRAVEDIIAEKD